MRGTLRSSLFPLFILGLCGTATGQPVADHPDFWVWNSGVPCSYTATPGDYLKQMVYNIQIGPGNDDPVLAAEGVQAWNRLTIDEIKSTCHTPWLERKC